MNIECCEHREPGPSRWWWIRGSVVYRKRPRHARVLRLFGGLQIWAWGGWTFLVPEVHEAVAETFQPLPPDEREG